MKKIIVTILAAGSLALSASAQGYFGIDSSLNSGDGATTASTTGGLVFIGSTLATAVVDTGTDISLGVLWGTSAVTATTPLNIDINTLNSGAYAGNINWIASQLSGQQDITFGGDGTFVDPNGGSFQIGSGTPPITVWLVLQGWTGAAGSYAGALVDPASGIYAGQSSAFSIVAVGGSVVPATDIHNMPSLNLVLTPEPSTLALAGLGGLSLLLIRRRK